MGKEATAASGASAYVSLMTASILVRAQLVRAPQVLVWLSFGSSACAEGGEFGSATSAENYIDRRTMASGREEDWSTYLVRCYRSGRTTRRL